MHSARSPTALQLSLLALAAACALQHTHVRAQAGHSLDVNCSMTEFTSLSQRVTQVSDASARIRFNPGPHLRP